MNQSWPSHGAELIARFVDSLHLAHETTRCAYRSTTLLPFHRFVIAHRGRRPVDPDVVVAWLRATCATAPVPRVIRHAQTIDYFLRWLVAQGVLAHNPVAELRESYQLASTACLVRAFAAPDPGRALAAAKPLPVFGSHLGRLMEDHVARMRAAGFLYTGARLRHFDRFLQRRPGASQADLGTLVREYAASASSAREQVNRWSVGRVVATAMRRKDPSVPIMRRPPALVREAERTRLRPHIYTLAEVERCLAAALRLSPDTRAVLRPRTVHLMIVLAYCAGLRFRELRRLRLADVHESTAEIDVRESKFFKWRRLPLAPTVIDTVKRYLVLRRRAGGPTDPESPLFWNDRSTSGYSTTCAARWINTALRRAGVKAPRGPGARIHDLRHTFAMHRLTDWYRRGKDVGVWMPFLSAYMGHKDIRSTLAYFTMTPELLAEAARRFRPLVARVIGPVAAAGRP